MTGTQIAPESRVQAPFDSRQVYPRQPRAGLNIIQFKENSCLAVFMGGEWVKFIFCLGDKFDSLTEGFG